MIVLRGGTVVDADGRQDADIVVDDGRILDVGPQQSERVEETESIDDESREIDVSGKYVTPGLVDAHVHLAFDARPDISTYQREGVAADAYRATANLRCALEAGVTTVRDLGSRGSVALEAASAVAEGSVLGPRVVAAGEPITMTGGHGHAFGREADGRAEVRKAAREQLKRGASVLKCMATGGVLTDGSRTGAPELVREEVEAVVETAALGGVPTAAHAHGRTGIENAVEAGIDSIEHGTFLDESIAKRMAKRGTVLVPTANALYGIVEAGDDAGIPRPAREKATEAARSFEASIDAATAAGVDIAMGTDAGTPFNEFASIPSELERLVDLGLSPATALESATVAAATLLGFDDIGRIRRGYRADLLVLPEDPLADVAAFGSVETVLSSASGETTVVDRPVDGCGEP